MAFTTGSSATIVFSSGVTYATRWTQVSGLRKFVEALDDTDLATDNYREKVPDDLEDLDPIEIEFFFDGSKALPALGTTCTITLTFPKSSTTPSTAAKLTGSGFITEFQFPDLVPGERVRGTLQFQFDGKTEPAFTVGS